MRARPSFRAALLGGALAALPVAAQAAGPSRFELSGFGTLGAAALDRPDARYGRATSNDGADDRGSLELDSRFGLQFDAELTPRWSATLQGVAREGVDGDPEATLEWGFVRWHASDSVTLRAGRLALPAFAVSDFREVGYANTPIRPPQDVYVQTPLTRFDGADLRVAGELGETLWSAQLAYGRAERRVYGDVDVEGRDSVGANVVFERGPARWRLSHIRSRLQADSPSLAALSDGIRRATPFVPALASIAGDYDSRHVAFAITVASLSLDFERWFVDAEYAYRRVDSWVHDADSWSVAGGLRLGAFTPYALASAFEHVDAGEHDVEFPDVALLAPLEAGLDRFNTDRTQSTLGVGLRWDFAPKLALKVQIERLRSERTGISFVATTDDLENTAGRFTLFSPRPRLRVLTMMNTPPSLPPGDPGDRARPPSRGVASGAGRTVSGTVPSRGRSFALALSVLLASLSGRAALAADECVGLVVIANATSEVSRLDAREVRKLFLGKSRRLPDGSRAVLASFDPTTSRFNAQALGRSDAQVTAAWSRLRFSGRVRPPHGFDSLEAIVEFVSSTPNSIAYLPACPVGEGVRTVHVVAS